MGLFSKKKSVEGSDPVHQELEAVRERLAAAEQARTDLEARLGLLDQRLVAVDDLDARVQQLTSRLDTPLVTPSPPPPPPPASSDSGSAGLREQLDALTERMSAADARVTSVSTELANQLTELSRDIDALNQHRATEAASVDDDTPTADAVDVAEVEARLTQRLDAAIDDVLDSTERLAAEQARYEIQFRADLAELAERLRRPPSSR